MALMARGLEFAAAAGLALLASACSIAARTDYVEKSAKVEAIRKDSLLGVDKAFAERAKAVGAAQAFRDFMAEDGKLLAGHGDPVTGSDAIFSLMATLPRGSTIDWTPVEALVAASGDLGVTWGEYKMSAPGKGGAVVEEKGRYVTVWRRDGRGRWRGVLDIGT
jgi:uncharacterized protein (TIGR02246 family)